MIRFKFLHTAALHPDELAAIRGLLDDAFDGKFEDTDWSHALGGMHVMALDDEELVAHGSVVQRSMLVGDAPLRCGYVEAIAVRGHRRSEGIGGNITQWLTEFVKQAYDFGALSASSAGQSVYARCGWELWRGDLAVLSPEGLVSVEDHRGSVMVLECSQPLDLDARIACDWRSGEAW
jgi:aminoglycoside 2'-N-acetyltransferase I